MILSSVGVNYGGGIAADFCANEGRRDWIEATDELGVYGLSVCVVKCCGEVLCDCVNRCIVCDVEVL